ncbi:MAG: hypothetical protein IPJ19_20155 [Planctomycetes bacterium]|nr:hypothetical protein [Planctomycetota bacterium]
MLDASGVALAHAILTWNTFDPELLGADVRTYRDDGLQLRAAARLCESDEQGDFEFDEAPALAREQPSVVWVTHPSVQGEGVLLDAGGDGWHWPSSVAWTQADPIQVRVVDTNGESVAGATVLQFLMMDAAGLRDTSEHALLARKFFLRSFTTDARGLAQVGLAEGRRMLLASKAALRSVPNWSTGPGEVTLVLTPTFELSGQVLASDPSLDLRHSYLAAYAADGSGDLPSMRPIMPRIDLRSDGGFGPIVCPVPDSSHLHLTARGGMLLDSQYEEAAPVAGQHVFVRMQAMAGGPIGVLIRDTQGKPIPGAWSIVTMNPAAVGQAIVGNGTTDEAGRAQLVVPRTSPFLVSAGKTGFAWVEGAVTAWSEQLGQLEFTLEPACTLLGRVVCSGKPVTRFEVAYWKEDAYRSKTLLFDNDEGTFQIADLPPGRISFFIEPPDYPQSKALEVELRPDGVEELLVELSEPMSARGTVIDAATREPVSSATITLYSSVAKQILHPRGNPVPVGSDGSFMLSGLGSEGDAYAVEAKGYSPTYGLVQSDGGKVTIGVVSLQPTSSARIELLVDPGDSPQRYSLFCDVGVLLPTTSFPVNGILEFDGLTPSAGILSLQLPDGGLELREISVRVGSCTRVVFDERAGHSVVLKFASETAASTARGGLLRIHEFDPNGYPTTRTQRVPAEGDIVASKLRLGPCTIEVLGADGTHVGHAGVEVTATGPAEALVLADAKLARLRVVDRDRLPLSGAKVELCTDSGLPPWQARGETDADGRVEFANVPSPHCVAALMHGGAGSAFGIPVDLGRAADAPIELILDARERIRIQCFENGKPREGVRFTMRHPTASAWGSTVLTSGENGLLESGALGEGTYPLEVSSGGIWPTRHMVRLPQKVTPERIDLVARTNLELKAVDSFDQPAVNVRFELEALEVPGDAASWLAALQITSSSPELATDSHGALVLRGLPAVTLRWRANAEDGTSTEGEIRLAAGAPNAVLAKLH